MASFEDTFDADLGAACQRLSAFVEPLPEGMVVDPVSRLTERDLALILRRLYATRHLAMTEAGAPGEKRPPARASVPLTARRGHDDL